MGIRPFLTSSDGAELPVREGFAPSKDFFTLMEALIMLNYKSLNAVTSVVWICVLPLPEASF